MNELIKPKVIGARNFRYHAVKEGVKAPLSNQVGEIIAENI